MNTLELANNSSIGFVVWTSCGVLVADGGLSCSTFEVFCNFAFLGPASYPNDADTVGVVATEIPSTFISVLLSAACLGCWLSAPVLSPAGLDWVEFKLPKEPVFISPSWPVVWYDDLLTDLV